MVGEVVFLLIFISFKVRSFKVMMKKIGALDWNWKDYCTMDLFCLHNNHRNQIKFFKLNSKCFTFQNHNLFM